MSSIQGSLIDDTNSLFSDVKHKKLGGLYNDYTDYSDINLNKQIPIFSRKESELLKKLDMPSEQPIYNYKIPSLAEG